MKTRYKKDEAWSDAWGDAYRWRANHVGKMPDDKYLRMVYARKREFIAEERAIKAREESTPRK